MHINLSVAMLCASCSQHFWYVVSKPLVFHHVNSTLECMVPRFPQTWQIHRKFLRNLPCSKLITTYACVNKPFNNHTCFINSVIDYFMLHWSKFCKFQQAKDGYLCMRFATISRQHNSRPFNPSFFV